jgi:hypothetical protein
MAVSLEQSVPLTGGGRELGKREWASDGLLCDLGFISLRVEGLSAWFELQGNVVSSSTPVEGVA